MQNSKTAKLGAQPQRGDLYTDLDGDRNSITRVVRKLNATQWVVESERSGWPMEAKVGRDRSGRFVEVA